MCSYVEVGGSGIGLGSVVVGVCCLLGVDVCGGCVRLFLLCHVVVLIAVGVVVCLVSAVVVEEK